jgi:hypothetical protein
MEMLIGETKIVGEEEMAPMEFDMVARGDMVVGEGGEKKKDGSGGHRWILALRSKRSELNLGSTFHYVNYV